MKLNRFIAMSLAAGSFACITLFPIMAEATEANYRNTEVNQSADGQKAKADASQAKDSSAGAKAKADKDKPTDVKAKADEDKNKTADVKADAKNKSKAGKDEKTAASANKPAADKNTAAAAKDKTASDKNTEATAKDKTAADKSAGAAAKATTAADKNKNVKPAEPAFPEKMPGKVNKSKIKKAVWQLAEGNYAPLMNWEENSDDISIMGPAVATEEQMVQFIRKRNRSPKINCSVESLVHYYYLEAGREGIRPDIALCQAIKETGTWSYGGDVLPSQNNFCGLGATGNHNPGNKFATPQLGARAHIQHLLAYTSTQRPHLPIVDPRYELVKGSRKDVFGKITKWTGLNGVWAVPGKHYGQEILTLWRQAKAPDKTPKSLDTANLAIKHNPKTAINWVFRGIVYLKQGNTKDAIADFTKAISLDKNFAEAYYDRALAYSASGEKSKAIEDYAKVIELQPLCIDAYFNRGVLTLNSKPQESLADFKKVLELNPQRADAMNNIALLLIGDKQYDKAWKVLYDAGVLNSENANVKKNQKLFQSCLKEK